MKESDLEKLDLGDLEGRIYLFLLAQGLSSPSVIAKGVSTQRPNTYHSLQTLLRRGLVNRQSKGKRFLYFAEDPEKLFDIVDEKRKAATELMPDLKALYKTQKNKPVVEFFDGFTEVQKIYESVFEAEEVCAIGSIDKLAALDNKFLKHWEKQLQKRGIYFKDIVTNLSQNKAAQAMDSIMGAYYKHRTLPAEYGDVPTDILVWNNKVALISLSKPIFGTIIENDQLAASFKIIFNVMWKSQELSTNV